MVVNAPNTPPRGNANQVPPDGPRKDGAMERSFNQAAAAHARNNYRLDPNDWVGHVARGPSGSATSGSSTSGSVTRVTPSALP